MSDTTATKPKHKPANNNEQSPQIKYRPKLTGIALVLSLIAAFGLLFIFVFSTKELNQELKRWQDKLNLIADSRLADVTRWVEGNFQELNGLAENASLQLYITEIEQGTDDPSQVTYLRNLLTLAAQRRGYEPAEPSLEERLGANVDAHATGGIALLDKDYKPMVQTTSMPPLDGAIMERITALPKGERHFLDFYKSAAGQPQVGFVVPVFALQGDDDAASQIGTIVGIRPVGADLFAQLKHPGVTEESLEVSLVRLEGDNIVYLSPLKDGSAPLAKRLSADPKSLDAAFALERPGSFAQLHDYQAKEVLFTGRLVPSTPWGLVTKINRAEALAENQKTRTNLMTIFLLAMACVMATIIAVWRHATSRKAYDLSVKATKLAAQAMAQEKLLRLVSDNQPEPIFIIDNEGMVRFANRRAADRSGVSTSDLPGKGLAAVLGPARAGEQQYASQMAHASGETYSMIKPFGQGSSERILRSEHVPLAHIPIDTLPFPTPGTLVIEQDVTDVLNEREKRVRILKQLVETLVSLVDQRDPFAARHSEYVSKIARAVATEIGLEEKLIDTAETAGRLLNVGKIAVPPEVLTKKEALADQEKDRLRNSLSASAELVKGIEFDGPVYQTLRQGHERFDGNGPFKMAGDEIMITARIVAVVNAFVGMVSARAFREAMGVDEAIHLLLEGIDKQYDRRVVVALVNYLDNRGGRDLVKPLAMPPKGLVLAKK